MSNSANNTNTNITSSNTSVITNANKTNANNINENITNGKTKSEIQNWKCGKCDKELTIRKVVLEYMGHTIQHDVPACPKCNKVYISKELAEGRMREAEETLEEK